MKHGADDDDDAGDDDGEEGERRRHRCDAFVANAAVHGDGFRWHVVRGTYAQNTHNREYRRHID